MSNNAQEKFEYILANGEEVLLDALPLPEGDYSMIVDTVTIGQSRAGDDMVKIIYGFITKDENLKKKKIYGNYLMEYAALKAGAKFNPAEIGRGQIDKLLKATGHDDGFDVLDEDISKLEELLMGEKFTASIKDAKKAYTNPNTGKTYLNSEIKAFKSK